MIFWNIKYIYDAGESYSSSEANEKVWRNIGNFAGPYETDTPRYSNTKINIQIYTNMIITG